MNEQFNLLPKSFAYYLRNWQMNVTRNNRDLLIFLNGVRKIIDLKLREEKNDLGGIKFQLAVQVELYKTKTDGTNEITTPILNHMNKIILQIDEIDDALKRVFPVLLERLEKWVNEGSGWIFGHVKNSMVKHC